MTKSQAEILKQSGISFPFLWAVLADLPGILAVKNILTGEVKVLRYDSTTSPMQRMQ